ncbi:sigma-54-dependent Fis family transcriptional regulator [Amphritea balenae]|uniref:Sigma-54-dependent Fis family transcriptional regulator n=1 Tax=Amphritea balenae TaxID=452629 RepID=A0A3P1SJZ6_9GAMM|nr:sigma-54-dependent Fis family transcriptional regulator [Amphritea balenae]RRC97065.1 sigma-54-dependent Fis family transcriptional regulator [Amphritea balenae]GGK67682.1 sigma-54-dependent Fis family transcriptional regulator [Amphritea balenae]
MNKQSSSCLITESEQSVKNARKHLVQEGEVPSGVLRSEIEDSWLRSVEAGLNCESPLDLENLSRDSIADLKAKNRPLIEASHPEVKQLVEYFSSVGGLVMLADADATILGVKGEQRYLDSQMKYALQPGANWKEDLRGTNAVGTAVVDRTPVMITGNEHFLDSAGYLSCCSAPITDAAGDVLGVLDLTSPTDNRELPPNMSLVQQAVRSIENRMFSGQFQQQIVLSVHSRPEYLRSSWQGLLALELDGYIQAANEQVCQLLNRKRKQLVGRNLEELFGVRPEALLTDLHRKGRGQLRTRSGDFVCELLHFPNSFPASIAKAPAKTSRTASKLPEIEAPDLVELAGLDARLQKGVRMGSRALAHELPVLIQGETGTGKEVMAKSLHLDSRRSSGPFIAVNCASIPEGLIESELFGYREGAFTGSRKGGMVGRLEQAQSGTLFLDEIGDMPLALQARLLRVLQERTIAPLGGADEIALDIAVICASHRDLKALVAEGSFREDLYYRLNGVCLRIPAFRDRTDKQDFISHFLHQLTPDGRQIKIADELMLQLEGYHWPGNIRQLETTLRVAIAFMEPDELVIDSSHISDDFLEELSSSKLPVSGAIQLNAANGTLKDAELMTIQQVLEQHEGNISATANELGISRATLYRKLKQLDE